MVNYITPIYTIIVVKYYTIYSRSNEQFVDLDGSTRIILAKEDAGCLG